MARQNVGAVAGFRNQERATETHFSENGFVSAFQIYFLSAKMRMQAKITVKARWPDPNGELTAGDANTGPPRTTSPGRA